MRPLESAANLTDRVYRAILDEILEGSLKPGEHLVQEQLANGLGVSRQPVQQAMALLKADGVVEDIGRRGLRVATVDPARMVHAYDLRAVLDGYAGRAAARAVADGVVSREDLRADAGRILSAAERAIKTGAVAEIIRQDEAFHRVIYAASGNPELGPATDPIWRFLRRAMADVIRHATPAGEIVGEHRAILDAVLAGDGDRAEDLSRRHIHVAADRLQAWLAADAAKTTGGNAT